MVKKKWRIAAVFLLSFTTTLALGLDFSLEIPKKLIAQQREGSLWAIIDNLLIVLNHFHTMDHMNGTLIGAACVMLYARYLFSERFASGWGEYVLAGFLALAMLVSEAMAAQATIACLCAGGTQAIKSLLFASGIYPLCLAAVRALKEGLVKLEKMPITSKHWWSRHPFGCSFFLLLICWAPYVYMKFPVGMSPDATMQILSYSAGDIAKDHPVFSTLIYGWLWQFGEWIAHPNLSFFLLTAAQMLAMAGVLAYSISCMQRWGVPFAVRVASVLLYCIVPNYSGWITTMVKDIPYLIGCLLMSILLIDFSVDQYGFFHKWKNWMLMIVAVATIWLWRRNGLVLVIACAIYMLVKSKYRKKAFILMLIGCTVGFGTQIGVETMTNARPAGEREKYSLLLQATGRIVRLHGDELPQEELKVIGKVLDYEKAAEEYSPIITDSVKFNFIENAGQDQYDAYVRVAVAQIIRYPLDALDSYLNLIYRIFDWRSDRKAHMDRREVEHPYYIRSYTNELYDQEPLQGLNAAQEAVENWNYWFPDLPIIGMFVNIGFCTTVLLALAYFAKKKKTSLAGMLPAFVTVGFLMLSSIVYIRYALPLTASLPLWFAAYFAKREEKIP